MRAPVAIVTDNDNTGPIYDAVFTDLAAGDGRPPLEVMVPIEHQLKANYTAAG